MNKYAVSLAVVSVALGSHLVLARSAARPSPGAGATRPHIGTWGFDVLGMDRGVKPGDDFYLFANGQWVKTTQIPPNYPQWDSFNQVYETANRETRKIVEEAAQANAAAGTNVRKLGDFYKSFMDEADIEANGTAPLRPYLARIAAISTRGELARAFAEATRLGIGHPIRAGIWIDSKNNGRSVAFLTQGGLGLPGRDYYLDDEQVRFSQPRARYRRHIANMLRLAGFEEADARAERVFQLERKIAEAHWPQTEMRQAEKTYNPMTQAEIAKTMPGFDWPAFFEAAGLGAADRFIVSPPSALSGAARLIATEPLDAWKDYLAFRTISSTASLLPKSFVEEKFAFDRTLSGAPRLPDRPVRAFSLVSQAMSDAVGEIYVARTFSPRTRVKAEAMVANVLKAMDARLEKLEWMTPETKRKAKAKLAAVKPLIGHSRRWRNYSALKILPGDAFGNAIRSRIFDYERDLSRLGRPVDREEWALPPYASTGYAIHAMNQIAFPAATLQPPFFDAAADDAVNYGAMGAQIGHELVHLFDDQGRKYDSRGQLSDWWTASDIAGFQARADKLVKQYSAYEPLPGLTVNGALTVGENIADLGGLAVAYDAYKLSLRGKPSRVIDGYTGDQRFFLGFAQKWRSKQPETLLRAQLATNPHSPSALRANTVRNFDPWYKAFNVRGGAMYLPPEQRIRIW
jgi:putative endopeptidase